MRVFRNFLLMIPLILLMACVYRQDIHQGNFLEEEDIEQVEVGMTRSQVRYLLGSPMLETPFHSDRWHFHYIVDSQREHRRHERYLTIHFDDQDRVQEISKESGRERGSSGP